MITGVVTNLHALIPVLFRLASEPDLTIEFVVDTGFTDYLTLPSSAVDAMGLNFIYDLPVNLADDSNAVVSVYKATILWHGNERDIRVFATGRRPLLGTALLKGSEFYSQFFENGQVSISEVQPSND